MTEDFSIRKTLIIFERHFSEDGKKCKKLVECYALTAIDILHYSACKTCILSPIFTCDI